MRLDINEIKSMRTKKYGKKKKKWKRYSRKKLISIMVIKNDCDPSLKNIN